MAKLDLISIEVKTKPRSHAIKTRMSCPINERMIVLILSVGAEKVNEINRISEINNVAL